MLCAKSTVDIDRTFAATLLPRSRSVLRAHHFIPYLWQRRAAIAGLFCGVLAPLLVFGKIADNIYDGDVLSFDQPLQLWARSWHSPGADRLMLTLSAFGSPPLMMVLCAAVIAVLLYLQRRGDALFYFLSIGGAGLLNVVAKGFFGRARPDLWVSIDPRADYSFPSGHAMGTMAVFAALVFLVWEHRTRWAFAVISMLLVFSVGVSRVYLGVHYPSDVLCGWCASLAWVFGLHRLREVRTTWRRRIPSTSST